MSEKGHKISHLPIGCLCVLCSHVNIRPGDYIKYEEPYLVGKSTHVFLFTLVYILLL